MTFKFVSEDYTGRTSAEADSLTSVEISGVFIEQEVTFGLRIGNTGSQSANYTIMASGVNTTINDDVEFSDDNGLTYATTATVSGIRPNDISDRIQGRYTPAEGTILGIGSFLLHVDEELI